MKNKIGAMVKLIYNKFYDVKLTKKTNILNQDIEPMFLWSTATQSIDYIYLKESLKSFTISENDIILDLGSGKGRLLLYLYNYYDNISLFGAEINQEAVMISKKLCRNTSIKIYHIDVLKDNFIKINKINKIILFNPFDAVTFKNFIEYLINNIDYRLEFIYINISLEQIIIFESYKLKFKKVNLHNPICGIDRKINLIGYLNE